MSPTRQLEIYEKKGIVLLVQEDHLSGEIIGTAIEYLYAAGAYNVQVIPTVTKKNRPGHLFLIDCGAEECEAVELVVLRELGATGWQKLETTHRHVGTEIQIHSVTFETPRGPVTFKVKVKAIRHQTSGLRPEHTSCLEVCTELRKYDIQMPLNEVREEILRQIINNFLQKQKEEQHE